MSKTVRLGSRLRYPITVVKLHKKPGDRIKKQETLMEYSFKWWKEVGDSIRGETWKEEQTTIVTWDSPSDGELRHWLIREGQHIVSDTPAMEVKEDCPHEIQFQGLCGMCGKDMTEVNWATETSDTARAPINMVHDQTNLTVSAVQAQRTEQELQRRLLKSRKLSLVVDLDQTIIQACIDPTVGEWQKDPTNPNHELAKEVKSFQLDDGPTDLARRCWYYIKMRPGLQDFLKRIAEMYELHVYTMGTRAYAQNVARVVDPDKKLFGNRVISRDENGNIFAKSLHRLFPVSTHMVAIIDDRSDVWPRNRPNLIKVSPYEFFKGIGDINSNLLPKRQDLLTSGATANGAKKGKKSKASENQEVAVAGTDDGALTREQVEEQERALEKQIKDRPLQVLQEQLDREDEEAEKATVRSDDSSESRSSSPPPHRHRVLQDDDEELKYLEQHLTALHRAFYDEYDRNRAAHDSSGDVDLDSVPDAGRILDQLKSTILQGKKIVLSGLLPRDTNIYRSELGLQIMSFGAELLTKVSRDVTHLVVNAAQPGREKLLQARRRPHIKIVSQEWLAACFSQWKAVDESPYLFTARLVEEDDPEHKLIASDEDEDEVEDTDTEADSSGRGLNGETNGTSSPRLKLISPTGQTHTFKLKTGESADDEESDPGEDDDEEEEIEEGLLPDDLPDGQSSPIDGLKTFNWGSADEELAEFLASGSDDEDEDEDEDEEGDGDDGDDSGPRAEEDEDEFGSSSLGEEDGRGRRSKSVSPSTGGGGSSKKRKDRDEDDEDDGDGGDEGQGENGTPAKRLRRTESQHGSSLRSLYRAGENGSSLPTPGRSDRRDAEMEGTEDNAVEEGDEVEGEEDEEMEIDVAELEAEFEAEFGKAEAELEAQMAAEETSGAEGDVGTENG
ncbi:uncharacterized protein P884DRAFT_107462 [Thermothelomyces heterothallicus CBS 202.75]|uniref:uncharacterized protein n=1 Tax=Thermothelomyces heterothallicus CBS 202.75 TaxID=1149848 RepID=UPI003742E69F